MTDKQEEVINAYEGLVWGTPEAEAVAAARDDDYVVIYNDEDGTAPSEVHGMKLIAGVFFAIVVFAFFLVWGIMHFSKKQEEGKRNTLKARKEGEITKLQNKLECKPWTDTTITVTDQTTSMQGDSFDDASFSSDPQAGSDASTDSPPVVAMAGMPEPPEFPEMCAFGKDGSVCALCTEPFQFGQPVVESNNPSCRHCHHKVCMDKWLEFQNTCPVCNQPYVLQTV